MQRGRVTAVNVTLGVASPSLWDRGAGRPQPRPGQASLPGAPSASRGSLCSQPSLLDPSPFLRPQAPSYLRALVHAVPSAPKTVLLENLSSTSRSLSDSAHDVHTCHALCQVVGIRSKQDRSGVAKVKCSQGRAALGAWGAGRRKARRGHSRFKGPEAGHSLAGGGAQR